MMRRMNSYARLQRGFTLLEIIVAVSIFAVITSIVFPGLIQFVDLRERLEEKHLQLIGLQKTFLFLSNDLRYAANRLAKDEYGEKDKTTIKVNDDGLLDLTAFYPDINLNGLSVPRRLRWVLEENELKRIQYPVMDPESETRTMVQTLLKEVEDVEVEVSFIEDGRDSTDDKWEEQTRLPDLITLKIEMQSGLEYRRVFSMLGGDTQQAIAAVNAAAQAGGQAGSGDQAPSTGGDQDQDGDLEERDSP